MYLWNLYDNENICDKVYHVSNANISNLTFDIIDNMNNTGYYTGSGFTHILILVRVVYFLTLIKC